MAYFDIAVIGGGIHGVGTAQQLAAQGYSVCVLEQADQLAQGTSSRSSKLIHGGLRYLESGQLRLVRECLRERQTLLENAPDLVKLQPFYIPVYKSTRRRPWQLYLGLAIYALLTGLAPAARFRHLPESEWEKLDGIRLNELQAVFQYYDAQTDDAMLTRSVMASAQSLGAELYLDTTATGISLGSPNIINYVQSGHRQSHECQIVVNAAGPWVNQVLDVVRPEPSRLEIEWVQGTHIIVPGKLKQGFYYIEAPEDQRAIFVMPWQGNIMVGTTEQSYQGDPATVLPTHDEKDYLLNALRHFFPEYVDLTQNDILHSFAGLRVLPTGQGSPFSRPRETTLLTDRKDRPRIVTIYGGKLTAYRATAEKLFNLLRPSLAHRKQLADTHHLKLTLPTEVD